MSYVMQYGSDEVLQPFWPGTLSISQASYESSISSSSIFRVPKSTVTTSLISGPGEQHRGYVQPLVTVGTYDLLTAERPTGSICVTAFTFQLAKPLQ